MQHLNKFKLLRFLIGMVLITTLVSYSLLPAHAKPMSDQQQAVFVQLGHSTTITSVAISPNGQYVLSGSMDKTLKLWEVKSGREVRTFKGHTTEVQAVAFSPDGRYVVSGSLDTGMLVFGIMSMDKSLRLWDVNTGHEVRTFEGHLYGVSSVAFSPDGRYVVSGNWDKTLKLWDVNTGHEVRTFTGHSGVVNSVAFSPDGRYVMSGSMDKTLKLWNVKSGREVRTFQGHTGWVRSVAFSPDGRYVVSGSLDNTLKLWEVKSGREVRTFKGHTGQVRSVAFSPDRRYVVSGSHDETLKLWDVNSGREVRTFKDAGEVSSVAISPDGRYVVSGSSDEAVKLWEVSTGHAVRAFKGHTDWVDSVAISPDGRYVVSGYEEGGTFNLWELSTGREVRTFKGHTDSIESVAFSPDGHYLVSGSQDETLKLWDVKSGHELRTFQGHTGGVKSVVFSPDGRYVVSGSSDETLKLWDVKSGREVRTFQGHTGTVVSVVFSPDGHYVVSGGHDETMKLWDVSSGHEVRTFKGHTGNTFSRQIQTVAISPNGRYVVSGSWDKTLQLWDVSTGHEVRTFKGHTRTVVSVVFSPDGSYLVSGSSDNTLKLWEVSSGHEVRTFNGHSAGVREVALSPDGRYVASGGTDGTTRLWDIASGKEVVQLISFTDGEWIAITPEGYYQASANGDQHLNVYIGNVVYSIERFRETFYQPRVVEAALRSGDSRAAITAVLGSDDQPIVATLAAIQPPRIRVTAPQDGASLQEPQALLTFTINDRHQPIKQVSVEVNGRRVNKADVRALKRVKQSVTGATLDAAGVHIPSGRKTLAITLPLRLEVGDNHIEILASNGFAEATHTLRLTVSRPAGKAYRPVPHDLWILAIGINSYKDAHLNSLAYAVADAQGIVAAFQRQQGRLFGRVHSKVISDRSELKPTYTNIVDNLDWLRQAAHTDLVVLFVAAHGLNDDRGSFYLLPSDAVIKEDGRIRKSRAISWWEFQDTLNLPAKKIVLVDTCHSEGISGRRTRAVNNDALARALKETRAVVLASSAKSELSQEGDEWGHGVFTYALIEGLKSEADDDNGVITMKELDTYVSKVVPKLTKGAQHPITYTPEGYRDFPVAKTQ